MAAGRRLTLSCEPVAPRPRHPESRRRTRRGPPDPGSGVPRLSRAGLGGGRDPNPAPRGRRGARRHPVRAVARLVTATPRRFDVGRALDEWFVNSMGFGFGPAVVRPRNAMPFLRGFLSYLVPIVRTFFSFRPPLFEVRASGFVERGYMMMVEVCNGTTAGGSYRFAPDADPADGKLDACLIRRVSLPRFL